MFGRVRACGFFTDLFFFRFDSFVILFRMSAASKKDIYDFFFLATHETFGKVFFFWRHVPLIIKVRSTKRCV